MSKPDFENLVRLLKLIGGKFIIVEDGKPTAVLMAYEEFENLAAPAYESELLDRVERVNQEITRAQIRDLREEVIAEWPVSRAGEGEPELTIEPLT